MIPGIPLWLANATVGIALLGLSGCGPYQQAKLDREVDRLCAIDGGVHVYETATLPKEDFGPDGDVFPQYRGRRGDEGRYGPDYRSRLESTVLISGDPALERIRVALERVTDGKVLGELVVYRRSGGDLPGPAEPTVYSCPKGPAFGLERRILLTREK